MTINTYRVWVSGKMSPRLSNIILHQMLESLGFSASNGNISSDQLPSIRNMHRGNEEAYFDVDIPLENNNDPQSIIESMKRYIIDNAVQYQDITTEPPKDM